MLKVLENIHIDPLKTNMNFKILIPQFSPI